MILIPQSARNSTHTHRWPCVSRPTKDAIPPGVLYEPTSNVSILLPSSPHSSIPQWFKWILKIDIRRNLKKITLWESWQLNRWAAFLQPKVWDQKYKIISNTHKKRLHSNLIEVNFCYEVEKECWFETAEKSDTIHLVLNWWITIFFLLMHNSRKISKIPRGEITRIARCHCQFEILNHKTCFFLFERVVGRAVKAKTSERNGIVNITIDDQFWSFHSTYE